MTLSVNNPDSGSAVEEVGVDYAADDIEIGFNSRYLLDVAAQLEDRHRRVPLRRSGLADAHPRRRCHRRALRSHADAGVSDFQTGQDRRHRFLFPRLQGRREGRRRHAMTLSPSGTARRWPTSCSSSCSLASSAPPRRSPRLWRGQATLYPLSAITSWSGRTQQAALRLADHRDHGKAAQCGRRRLRLRRGRRRTHARHWWLREHRRVFRRRGRGQRLHDDATISELSSSGSRSSGRGSSPTARNRLAF